LRRVNTALFPLALAGLVFGLDLFWHALSGASTGLAYGLLDEPAHLATAVVLLLALGAFGTRLSGVFIVGAAIASVAIDIDHIPGILGSQLLTGGEPRPYSHSLITVLALVLVGQGARGRTRQLALGAAFGVGAHLLRDLATGPGVPLLWPASGAVIAMPYPIFATTLALAASIAAVTGWSALTRSRFGLVGMFVVTIVVAVLAASPSLAGATPTISLGAYIPGAGADPSLIDEYASEVGRQPVIVSSYRNWDSPLFDERQLDAVSSRGAVPMLTWEPWDHSEAGASLWAIAAGDYDSYVSATARQAAAWGKPLFLRFAHEMNGDWYPWGWGVDGNTPAAYKVAWRHVVDVFRAEGASNVRWVWCPYVSNVRPRQFRRFYPGDAWVDWAGLDGFNWGAYRTWQSFKTIFAISYQRLIKVTGRPVMIAETGVNDAGGNKPRWISRSLLRKLPRYTHVRALVWFDSADSRADFRVDSSAGSLAAIRRAFGAPIYSSSSEVLLNTPTQLQSAHRGHRPHRKGHRPKR
jgi:membrane-bound metal-dependent hydrolase YbcI (DUF457 family)